jgi:hypothetical protein
MKILHTEEGFTQEDLLSYKPIVFHNTLSSMKTLIQAASSQFSFSLLPENIVSELSCGNSKTSKKIYLLSGSSKQNIGGKFFRL